MTIKFNLTANEAVYNVETFPTMFGILPENAVDEKVEYGTAYNVIKLMYFSYTTLSTVGFGDLTPRSDYERLICCAILIGGVAAFGFILNILMEIID